MKFTSQKPELPGFQITPMLDVVFLLLCFFVTTSVFSRRESEISVKLPTAETGSLPESLPGEGYHPYYLYRQTRMTGNLENVGYALEGHEGLYNIFMMEELHTIFGIGAGAVTKLVDYRLPKEGRSRIVRLFTPKYPYEYLRDADRIRDGAEDGSELPLREKIFRFFENGNPEHSS